MKCRRGSYAVACLEGRCIEGFAEAIGHYHILVVEFEYCVESDFAANKGHITQDLIR